MTSVQDAGRKGLAYYAIPKSGPLHKSAANLANTLVGNPDGAAVIEFNLQAGHIVFDDTSVIALTGSDMRWKINGDSINRNETIIVNPGDKLTGSYATEGQRGYLAIRGTIKGQKNMGALAAYSYGRLGYNQGQAIKNNHLLEWEATSKPIQLISISQKNKSDKLKIYKGPEYDLLTKSSKGLLTSGSFCISPISNRMGARLEGPELHSTGIIHVSVAVLPGFLQLVPSGQLIVIQQDGQTTGGYPRVAYLKESELDQLNQFSVSKAFTFTVEN